MRQNNWTWAGLLLLAVIALLVYLNGLFPGVLENEYARMRLVHALGWLGLITASVAVGWRGRGGLALKQALVWVAVALILIVIYSYRDDFLGIGHQVGQRVATSLAPTTPVQGPKGVVYLTREMHSDHFRVNALVNGTAVNFLVDTGASDVAISTDDARRLGFNLEALKFNMPYQTANGIVMAARITLDEIQIGDIRVRNVVASIAKGNDSISLLGMSFLNRIGGIEVSGDRLILRP